eukprot:6845070-Prymnesium_polylepis.1
MGIGRFEGRQRFRADQKNTAAMCARPPADASRAHTFPSKRHHVRGPRPRAHDCAAHHAYGHE